jgi:hypothetical protein
MEDDHGRPDAQAVARQLQDGSSTWTWIAGGLCLAFVLAILFTMSSGDKTQVAFAPPAYDRMIMPPITQP